MLWYQRTLSQYRPSHPVPVFPYGTLLSHPSPIIPNPYTLDARPLNPPPSTLHPRLDPSSWTLGP
eukprot:2731107-Rhodomonas_salina.5